MKLAVSALLVGALVLPAVVRAQPGDPPPSDADVAAQLAPARVLGIARELGEIEARLRSQTDPVARVRLRARTYEIVGSLATDLFHASGRAVTLPAQALSAVERTTGHPVREITWARDACAAEVARTHVLGDAGRGCLVHDALPYGLQLPLFDSVYAEGTEEQSRARFDTAAACVRDRPTDRDCRVRLASMQIESRDLAGARASVVSLGADPDARYLRAIVQHLEGDHDGALRALASLVAEDPPHRTMAAFQLARFVELGAPRGLRSIELDAYLVFLCHAEERDDQRAGFHWMRTAATSGAYAIAGYVRPILPLELLPSMTSGYPTSGAPRHTCPAVTRRARSLRVP